MSDLRTMIWKESNDFLLSNGLYDLLRPLLIVAILGIVFPLSFKQIWLNLDATPVLVILLAPFMFVITFISDAFAGERERHTLETLLSSRISDRAVLFGKIIVAVGFTWGMTFCCLLLGVVVVNLSQGHGKWLFYGSASAFLVVLALSFLTILLAASSGVLVSLKSSTVRQAAQTMLLGEIILGLSIYGIVRLLPKSLIASLTTSQVVGIILLTLTALDAILLAVSLVSFRRARLILG